MSTEKQTRTRIFNDPQEQAQATFEAFDTLPDAALIDIQVLARLLDKSEPTAWRYRREGLVPPPVRLGRATLWRVSDIRAFLANLPVDREVA